MRARTKPSYEKKTTSLWLSIFVPLVASTLFGFFWLDRSGVMNAASGDAPERIERITGSGFEDALQWVRSQFRGVVDTLQSSDGARDQNHRGNSSAATASSESSTHKVDVKVESMQISSEFIMGEKILTIDPLTLKTGGAENSRWRCFAGKSSILCREAR